MNESQCGFQIFAEINRNKESVYKVQGMEEGIDLTDFCEALFRMNLGIGVDDATKLFGRIDTGGDGTIQYSEFALALKKFGSDFGP